MKTRIISAIVALAIVIPLIMVGGTAFNVGVYVISLIALKEFLDIKASKKQLPIFIQLIAYIFFFKTTEFINFKVIYILQ